MKSNKHAINRYILLLSLKESFNNSENSKDVILKKS